MKHRHGPVFQQGSESLVCGAKDQTTQPAAIFALQDDTQCVAIAPDTLGLDGTNAADGNDRLFMASSEGAEACQLCGNFRCCPAKGQYAVYAE